jgi:hypothetical protein
MQFCATYNYSAGSPLFDPQEKIRIDLLFGPPASVTLRIGHGPVHHKVFLLDPLPIIAESVMKSRAVASVTLEGGAVNRISCIQAHTALKTAAGHGSTITLHFYLIHEVFGAPMQVSEAVDLLIA